MLTSEEASYASGLRVAVTGGQPILRRRRAGCALLGNPLYGVETRPLVS